MLWCRLFSDKLCISANMAGDLILKIDTTMVVAKTLFHDLHAPKWRLFMYCADIVVVVASVVVVLVVVLVVVPAAAVV